MNEISHNAPHSSGMVLNPLGSQTVIVTGGIGSGKSYVMKCLEEMGFAIFNSDEVIRSLLQPDGAAYAQVKALFPSAVKDGVIDRAILSGIAFSSNHVLEQLEEILYPLLRKQRAQWIKEVKANSKQSLAIEIPLFFEKGVDVPHDLVLATVCDIEVQKQRALARGKMNAATVDAVLARQVSNYHRVAHADLIIDTNSSQQNTYKQLGGLVL